MSSAYAVAMPTDSRLLTRRASTRLPLLVPAGDVHARARKQPFRAPSSVPALQINARSLRQIVSVHSVQRDCVDSKASSKKKSSHWLDTCSAEEKRIFGWLFWTTGAFIALFGVLHFNVFGMFLAQLAGQSAFVLPSVGQLLTGFVFGAALMASVLSCILVTNELQYATGSWHRLLVLSLIGGPFGILVAAPVFWLTIVLEGAIWIVCMYLVGNLIRVSLTDIVPAAKSLISRPVRNVTESANTGSQASKPAAEAKDEQGDNLEPQRHGNAAPSVKQPQPEDKEVSRRTPELSLAAYEELRQQVASLEKLNTELVGQVESLQQELTATREAAKDKGIDGQC